MIELVHINTRKIHVEEMGYGGIREVGRALPEVDKYTITTQADRMKDNLMDYAILGWSGYK